MTSSILQCRLLDLLLGGNAQCLSLSNPPIFKKEVFSNLTDIQVAKKLSVIKRTNISMKNVENDIKEWSEFYEVVKSHDLIPLFANFMLQMGDPLCSLPLHFLHAPPFNHPLQAKDLGSYDT